MHEDEETPPDSRVHSFCSHSPNEASEILDEVLHVGVCVCVCVCVCVSVCVCVCVCVCEVCVSCCLCVL